MPGLDMATGKYFHLGALEEDRKIGGKAEWGCDFYFLSGDIKGNFKLCEK